MCAASTRITTAGGSSATPAGGLTTCCRISRRRRISSAARTNFTAPAGRCRCRIRGIRDPLSDAFIEAAAEAGIAEKSRLQRRGPGRRRAGFRPRRGAGGGRARRGPIFARRGGEAICGSRPRRWRSASCSRDAARWRSNTSRAGCSDPRARQRRSWSPAAPITRRSCCSSPASVPPICSRATASRSCWMRRASAATCRITCRSASSPAARNASR